VSQLQDDLNAVAALLEPEGAWCQGAYAYDRHRYIVPASSPLACSRCLVGAVIAAGGEATDVGGRISPRQRAMRRALEAVIGLDRSATAWNDQPERMQAEVVSLVRQAAATA
jgi:hypothetical protein